MATWDARDEHEQILQACRALFSADQVTELRILGLGNNGKRHGASGWFNDHDTLATVAANFDTRARPEGLYVTLNPVHQGCLARSANAVQEYCKTTTSDRDIIRRHWLPVDIDPVRPAGIPSTADELNAARTVARDVYSWLTVEQHWPAGIRALSGNGWHLLFRVDLPNDDVSAKLIQRCLQALSERFSNDAAKVDTSNWNASRIFKLYGTVARKGGELADRPHRQSRLLPTDGRVPVFAEIKAVSTDQLQALADQSAGSTAAVPSAAAGRPPRHRAARGNTQPINESPEALAAYLAEHGIAIRKIAASASGALLYPECCPFSSSHGTGSDTAIKLCADGRILFECKHDSCQQHRWADLRNLIDPDHGARVEARVEATAQRTSRVAAAAESGAPVLDRDSPLEIAREFATRAPGRFVRHAGRFYEYTGRHYTHRSDEQVKTRLYEFLDGSIDDEGNPFRPKRRNVGDAIDALTAVTQAPFTAAPPCWLEPQLDDRPCSRLISVANGILDVDTLDVTPATDRMFSTWSIDVRYSRTETMAPAWRSFLAALWPGDQESIDTLQEWFGYVLAGGTSLHKILLFVGPKRSGKGTIGRVLRSLLGECNVAAPTLASLQTNFGLQSLVDRPLAIIGDARLSGRADQPAIVERLLTISGEDAVDIDRKYHAQITVQLPTRFMLLTNELPRLSDPSGAMASRFVVLVLHNSWIGQEDTTLFDKLKIELPAILNWALDGWVRLRSRGHFVQPASSTAAAEELEDLSSPIGSFLKQCCTVDPKRNVECGRLYRAWVAWCRSEGRDKPGTRQSFGRDLRSAVSGLWISQPRVEDGRLRFYEGVGLDVELDGTQWHANGTQTDFSDYDHNLI